MLIYFNHVQRLLLLLFLINDPDVCVNSEQISEKERIAEMKQKTIEQMTEIMNLMRKTHVHNIDDDQIRALS